MWLRRLIFYFLWATCATNQAIEALPDIVPIADEDKKYVYGWRLDQTTLTDRVLLRLSTSMGNKGKGPLEIWGGKTTGTTQQVYQRIYNSNGTSRDYLAGNFIYHQQHAHVHFDHHRPVNGIWHLSSDDQRERWKDYGQHSFIMDSQC